MLAYLQNKLLEAGVDEAGRGCLAGPVFASAVILPRDFHHPWLNDSKQLSARRREQVRAVIEKEALAWAVARAEVEEIDSINILQASQQAMHRAIAALPMRPELLLVDGNYFRPFSGMDHRCIVKGDSTYASIAAASILAKTCRDEYMLQLHPHFPQYRWDSNKGYGTAEHRQALVEYGLSPHHRRSFTCLPQETG